MRLVRHAVLWIPGPCVRTVDKARNEHLAAAFREQTGILRRGGRAGGQADKHLRRPIRVGDRDHVRTDLSIRSQKQSFSIYPVQDRPAHRMHSVACGLGDQRWPVSTCDVFDFLHRRAFVDDAQDLSQARSVWLDRTEVSFFRRIVRVPELASTFRCRLQLAH